MVKVDLRLHPEVLFCYSANHNEIIIRVENHHKEAIWVEADIKVPEMISLSSTTPLGKGRVRIGIIEKNQFLEKAVRIYANTLTPPQVYKCSVTIYSFNKDGIIENRMDLTTNIRCERKKDANY